ncbi:MAG: hypothetical protein K8L99_13960, partial [Anaerolineae bacterium]|nr:hypothetical protein [Anaerolineae bacterium]
MSILTDPDMMPLPVGLTYFQGRYSTDYVGMIAAVVVTIVPSIAIYSLLQRRIVSGMMAGAPKRIVCQAVLGFSARCCGGNLCGNRNSLKRIDDSGIIGIGMFIPRYRDTSLEKL